jgi:hypothetical protein
MPVVCVGGTTRRTCGVPMSTFVPTMSRSTEPLSPFVRTSFRHARTDVDIPLSPQFTANPGNNELCDASPRFVTREFIKQGTCVYRCTTNSISRVPVPGAITLFEQPRSQVGVGLPGSHE